MHYYNEDLISIHGTGFFNIGTCNTHIIHNAFLKGLEIFGESVSDFITNVYYYFKYWPARQEEFSKIQDDLELPRHSFLKHVSTQWLTIGPAAKRLLDM